jgi:hypothetical protein
MPQQPNADDHDRPRGILSPVDRKWLKGTKEYDYRQAEDKRKREIHERIQNAIYDLDFILRNSSHPDISPTLENISLSEAETLEQLLEYTRKQRELEAEYDDLLADD